MVSFVLGGVVGAVTCVLSQTAYKFVAAKVAAVKAKIGA